MMFFPHGKHRGKYCKHSQFFKLSSLGFVISHVYISHLYQHVHLCWQITWAVILLFYRLPLNCGFIWTCRACGLTAPVASDVTSVWTVNSKFAFLLSEWRHTVVTSTCISLQVSGGQVISWSSERHNFAVGCVLPIALIKPNNPAADLHSGTRD